MDGPTPNANTLACFSSYNWFSNHYETEKCQEFRVTEFVYIKGGVGEVGWGWGHACLMCRRLLFSLSGGPCSDTSLSHCAGFLEKILNSQILILSGTWVMFASPTDNTPRGHRQLRYSYLRKKRCLGRASRMQLDEPVVTVGIFIKPRRRGNENLTKQKVWWAE